MSHTTQVIEPGARRVLPVTFAVIAACLLASLACLASSGLAWNHNLTRRPFVVQAGRMILTAEFTIDPSCASLAEDCMSHHRPKRYRYFSVWLYRTTPPTVPWQITYWHLIDLRVGPGDQ